MINKPERIKNVFLKTLMIESECFIKLKKLIFDGPKYLLPLVDGIGNKLFSIFFNDPEKLFQVDFSLTNFQLYFLGGM